MSTCSRAALTLSAPGGLATRLLAARLAVAMVGLVTIGLATGLATTAAAQETVWIRGTYDGHRARGRGRCLYRCPG